MNDGKIELGWGNAEFERVVVGVVCCKRCTFMAIRIFRRLGVDVTITIQLSRMDSGHDTVLERAVDVRQ